MTENALDAMIRIISLAIVQNQLTTKIKRPSLEVIGAIAKANDETCLMPQSSNEGILDMAYWMEIAFHHNVDQSILYDVSADVDTAYSTKSGNVIDEAAQLRECESVIPLQLSSLRDVILIGDEMQLPGAVQIQGKVEFGHKSRKNMAEVAFIAELVKRLHIECVAKKQKISVGCITPYTAQVD
uniref:Probable helicase MAGATAMA 3 n=1 Tax=Tanacetum cinerariifolium TaxID=118510 RepID=A0A6L2P3N1_TANCI|nr:probable helicase MAGATAMA 3 [Tanacetum cinerariifolium]